MKWFTINGASDDLVLVEVRQEVGGATRTRAEEISVSTTAAWPTGWEGSIFCPATGEQLSVVVFLLTDGRWSAGIAQVEEGYRVPEWPVTFSHGLRGEEPGYATRMTVEVPDDAVLSGPGLGIEGLG